jgi:hypothetical protein
MKDLFSGIATIALILNGCMSETHDISEFTATTSSISYQFNFSNMTYRLFSADNTTSRSMPINNCSDELRYCLSGPFFLSIKLTDLAKIRSNIGKHIYESQNQDMHCAFIFHTNENKETNLLQFNCKYRNGMPWPEFKSVGEPLDIFQDYGDRIRR